MPMQITMLSKINCFLLAIVWLVLCCILARIDNGRFGLLAVSVMIGSPIVCFIFSKEVASPIFVWFFGCTAVAVFIPNCLFSDHTVIRFETNGVNEIILTSRWMLRILAVAISCRVAYFFRASDKTKVDRTKEKGQEP